MDKIKKYILEMYKVNNSDLQQCSRIIKKNIVYHLEKDKINWAIKIFFGEDYQKRFKNELYMYILLENTKVLNVPKIMDFKKIQDAYILIIDWIEGKSLKNIIKEKGFNKSLHYILNMLNDMEKVWDFDIKQLTFLELDKIGINARLNKSTNEILNEIAIRKPNIEFCELFSIYESLINTINPKFEYMINSDVSAHEYIISNNKAYWIDFEKFKIGDPNNDLARSFQSITNVFFNNENLVEYLYEIFSMNKYFNNETFIYYLTEKIMCSIHDAPDQISDEEILFYISFIKNKYNAYKKQL